MKRYEINVRIDRQQRTEIEKLRKLHSVNISQFVKKSLHDLYLELQKSKQKDME